MGFEDRNTVLMGCLPPPAFTSPFITARMPIPVIPAATRKSITVMRSSANVLENIISVCPRLVRRFAGFSPQDPCHHGRTLRSGIDHARCSVHPHDGVIAFLDEQLNESAFCPRQPVGGIDSRPTFLGSETIRRVSLPLPTLFNEVTQAQEGMVLHTPTNRAFPYTVESEDFGEKESLTTLLEASKLSIQTGTTCLVSIPTKTHSGQGRLR